MTPIKDPAESVVIEFDFAGEMSAIGSAVVSITVEGIRVDSGVAAMLQGAHQISTTKVLQRVQGGLADVNYRLKCVATNGLDKIVRADIMSVKSLPA